MSARILLRKQWYQFLYIWFTLPCVPIWWCSAVYLVRIEPKLNFHQFNWPIDWLQYFLLTTQICEQSKQHSLHKSSVCSFYLGLYSLVAILSMLASCFVPSYFYWYCGIVRFPGSFAFVFVAFMSHKPSWADCITAGDMSWLYYPCSQATPRF